MRRLTEAAFSAQPRRPRELLADGSGLQARHRTRGGGAYFFRDFRDGIRTTHTVGHFPKMGLREARVRMAELQEALDRAPESDTTMDAVAVVYVEAAFPARTKREELQLDDDGDVVLEPYAKKLRAVLQTQALDIVPPRTRQCFGSLPLREVRPADLQTLVNLARSKRPSGKRELGGIHAAKRLVAGLKDVAAFAMLMGKLEVSPFAAWRRRNLNLPPGAKRQRALSDEGVGLLLTHKQFDLAGFLEGRAYFGTLADTVRAAAPLLLHTGLRTAAFYGTPCSAVVLEAATLVVAGHFTKGRKDRKAAAPDYGGPAGPGKRRPRRSARYERRRELGCHRDRAGQRLLLEPH